MAATINHIFNQGGIDSYNQSYGAIQAAMAQADGMARAASAQARGNVGAARESARGSAVAANQQGLSGLGNAYSGAYGAYAGGLGNVAQAMANEASNRYGANAMAEAARQAAAGNIGSSALGAFGGGLNSALGAWGANQASYNQALASMQNANQAGLSGLGQSRNSALGQLGSPYSAVGRGLIGADIAGGLIGGIVGGAGGNGSFSANGVNGPIATGSYSSARPGSAAGSTSLRPGVGEAAMRGLNDLRGNIMDNGVMNEMTLANSSAMRSLDDRYMSSRNMPMQMLNSGAMTIGGLAGQAYGQLRDGMNQFYGTMNAPGNRTNYNTVLAGLRSGYGDANANIGALPGHMSAGLDKFLGEKPMDIPNGSPRVTYITPPAPSERSTPSRRPFITDLRGTPTTSARPYRGGPTWMR